MITHQAPADFKIELNDAKQIALLIKSGNRIESPHIGIPEACPTDTNSANLARRVTLNKS